MDKASRDHAPTTGSVESGQSPARTCKTCRWVNVSPNDLEGGSARCDAPGNIKPTGFRSDRHHTYCSSHRDAKWLAARMDSYCGREGRWWAPKAEERAPSSAKQVVGESSRDAL